MSNFYSVLIVFCQFFTWIALGDAALCFSLTLVRKANALEEETRWAHDYITNVINPYTWQMLWQWHHFLQHKTSDHSSCMPHHVKPKIIAHHLSKIALNWTLSCTFEKLCKFSRHSKAKSCKKRPACTEICFEFHVRGLIWNREFLSFVISQMLVILTFCHDVSSLNAFFRTRWRGSLRIRHLYQLSLFEGHLDSLQFPFLFVTIDKMVWVQECEYEHKLQALAMKMARSFFPLSLIVCGPVVTSMHLLNVVKVFILPSEM